MYRIGTYNGKDVYKASKAEFEKLVAQGGYRKKGSNICYLIKDDLVSFKMDGYPYIEGRVNDKGYIEPVVGNILYGCKKLDERKVAVVDDKRVEEVGKSVDDFLRDAVEREVWREVMFKGKVEPLV